MCKPLGSVLHTKEGKEKGGLRGKEGEGKGKEVIIFYNPM